MILQLSQLSSPHLCRLLKIVSWGLSHSKFSEKKFKNFCQREIAFFFEKFGSGLLRSERNHHIACKILVKVPFIPLQIVPWRFLRSITREKRGQYVFFFTGIFDFLQKFVFSTTFQVLKKGSYNFHHVCQITLWSLTSYYSMCARAGNSRRNGPKLCFLRDGSFHFEKFSFRLLKLWWIDLISSTIIVRTPWLPLKYVFEAHHTR